MENSKFDEMQTINRNKIGYQAFNLILVLIVLNEFIKNFYVWAMPTVETLLLVFIPIAYFDTLTMIKGCNFTRKYLSDNATRKISIIFFAFCVAFLWYLMLIKRQPIVIIENGQLSDKCADLLLNIFWLYRLLLMVVQKMADKKKEVTY